VNTSLDLLDEVNESFAMNLANPSGATVADGQGQARSRTTTHVPR